MWEFEGPAEGEDAESPATNGQAEPKQGDDADMTMGDAAAPGAAGGKHAPIPTPAKAGEPDKAGTPAQTQQGKQPGPKFGTGVNQGGKGFEGRRQHRYFVLKSKSMFNVDQSVERGIWATQVCHYILSSAMHWQLITGHHLAGLLACPCALRTSCRTSNPDKALHSAAMTFLRDNAPPFKEEWWCTLTPRPWISLCQAPGNCTAPEQDCSGCSQEKMQVRPS